MAKGIYERKGKNGDVTYYIRYQVDGTDIKERVGRKSRGFTREMAKDALKARLGEIAQGRFNLEKARKPVPFSKLAERYREFAGGYKRGWETEKYIVDEFASLFGTTPLANITTWQIEKWKAEQGKDLHPGDGEPALDCHQAYVPEGGGLGIDQDESGNGSQTFYRGVRANAVSNRGRGSESPKPV